MPIRDPLDSVSPSPEGWINMNQAVEETGYSRQVITEAIHKGKIVAMMGEYDSILRQTWRVEPISLLMWMGQKRRGPDPPPLDSPGPPR